MDRNDYYGGESTSLNLNQVQYNTLSHVLCLKIKFLMLLMMLLFVLFLQLWKKFRGEDKAPAHLGSSRDYNVDMMPKVFIFSLASLLLIRVTTTKSV